MRILKHPIFAPCTCDKCGTVFQVDRNDSLERVYYGRDVFGWRIGCPLCHHLCDLDWAGMVNNSDATDTNAGLKSEWISVEERLPEPKKWVLVFTRHMHHPVVCFYEDVWYFLGGFFSKGQVTHWMPLPSAPEKEENNG